MHSDVAFHCNSKADEDDVMMMMTTTTKTIIILSKRILTLKADVSASS